MQSFKNVWDYRSWIASNNSLDRCSLKIIIEARDALTFTATAAAAAPAPAAGNSTRRGSSTEDSI